MLKSLHSLGSCAENFLLIQISSILSVIFTRLWLPESVLISQLHFSKACWELWLSEDQPHSDYNGQWQMALCILAVLQSSQPNPQRNEKKNRKMYAIKQIKICAEYRDMLPRPRLDLSGTPGLRPIGLSPGSWQTSLGLGSMSRYSAQIWICIAETRWPPACKYFSTHLWNEHNILIEISHKFAVTNTCLIWNCQVNVQNKAVTLDDNDIHCDVISHHQTTFS